MIGEAPDAGPEVRPGPNRNRAGFGHRSVFTVFALSISAALVGGILIFFKFVAYGRVAARHLPDDTALAARLDVETLLISEPVRRELLPLFDQGAPPLSPGSLKPRHDRFRAHTGVELGRDLREIVLGISSSGWVVVFGGKFPRSGLIEGLQTTLEEEHTEARYAGGVLQVRGGPAIGQATDGALVVASDAARLQAALGGGNAYLSLGLPPEGAGGFAFLVREPTPAGFENVERVSGAVELGKTMAVDVAVRLRNSATAGPEAVAAAFRALGERAPRASLARRPLSTARILPRRPDEVAVKLSFDGEELDAGAAWLGQLLAAQFAQGRRGP